MMAQSDIIRITAIDPPGPAVQCRHGDGPSKPTGQNGWQFTARPRRDSMTEFMGFDPYTLVVPVIFGNGFDTSVNVDSPIEVLRGLGRNLVGPRIEPAVLKISCPLIPLTWLTWTLQDMTFNVEYRNDDGSRYYAALSLTFFEYVPTDLVATKGAKSIAMKTVTTKQVQAGSSQVTTAAKPYGPPATLGPFDNPAIPGVNAGSNTLPTSGSMYVVKKGDTLETIAQKKLGAAKFWTQIAALNGNIRDPKSIKVGQVLRLPKDATVKKDLNEVLIHGPVGGPIPGLF